MNDKQIIAMIKMGNIDRLGKKRLVKNCCPEIQDIKPNRIGQVCRVMNTTTCAFHQEVWVCTTLRTKPEYNLMKKVIFHD